MMFPCSIDVHDYCSSTMDLAREWVLRQSGPHKFHFIQAYTQKAGRGKREREWVSEKGNFFGTLIMPFPFSLEKRGDMSFLTAVAVGEALRFLDPNLNVHYKWPNDIVVDMKKVGGILLESLENKNNHSFLNIGIGLNFLSHPDHISSTCLKKHMNGLPPLDVFRDVLIQKIFHYYEIWVKDGFQEIRDLWLARAIKRHKEIQIVIGRESLSGIFETIDDRGGLVLICRNGIKKTFYTGEVFFES